MALLGKGVKKTYYCVFYYKLNRIIAPPGIKVECRKRLTKH